VIHRVALSERNELAKKFSGGELLRLQKRWDREKFNEAKLHFKLFIS